MKSALSRCAIFFFVIGGLMTLLALPGLVFSIPTLIWELFSYSTYYVLLEVTEALLRLFQGLFVLTFAVFCLQFSRTLPYKN